MSKEVKGVIVKKQDDVRFLNDCASMVLDPDDQGLMPCNRSYEPCDGCPWHIPDLFHEGDTMILFDDGSVKHEKAARP